MRTFGIIRLEKELNSSRVWKIEVFEIARKQFDCVQINKGNYQTYNQIIYKAKT